MQLSVSLINFAAEDPGSWQHLFDQARAADEAGLDRIVVSDHIAYGEQLEAYGRPEVGGIEGGKQPTGPDGHWLEPLTVLSVVAGRTSQVRLGTNILQAALRTPAVLAKTCATLDVLSGGRLDLGVGVGWQREEYEASGLAFDGRGALLDRTLAVCRTLWTEARADFDDGGLRFSGLHAMPKPRQAGGVPIWVSGRLNKAVLSRLARFGSGWIPWGEDAADLVHAIPRMREGVAAAGGDATGLGVVASLPVLRKDDGSLDAEGTAAAIPGLAEAGASDARLAMRVPWDYAEAHDVLAAIVTAARAVS